MIERMQGRWNRLWRFLTHDLWVMDVYSMAGLRRTALKSLRVLVLAARGYRKDRLPLHASSLTNTTLLSLVPALAITFALMKGLGMERDLLNWIAEHTAEMPEKFQEFVNSYIVRSITDLNFAALGGVGVAFLLVTTVQLMSSIEDSFNTIWAVRESRPLLRMCTDYISTIIVVPVLILAAGTLRSPWLLGQLGDFSALYQKALVLSGFFTAWLAFTFVYKLLPNTRVNLRSAVVAGLGASIAWMTWQKIYVLFQFGVARLNPIYGTFATIPIFILWLYASWVIVLVGAELSFALQNSATFAAEQRSADASTRVRIRLALEILASAASGQRRAGRGVDLSEFARERGAPLRLLHHLCDQLKQGGLLVEVKDAEETYVLAWPADQIRVREVVRLLLDQGAHDQELGLKEASPAVTRWLKELEEGWRTGLADASLAEVDAAPST
jgi:membrane protein